MNNASILAVTMAYTVSSQRTNSPKPPENPLFKWIAVVLALCLMLALCACSTPPVKGPLWIPPASAMVKSQPLPALAVEAQAKDDDASTIDLPALVSDSLDVTKMYRALAKRHDELVDAVMKKLQQQAQ